MNDIEKMAKLLYRCSSTTCDGCRVHCMDYLRAELLVNAGYGEVKQAVREFADKLIDELCDHCIDNKNVNKK